MPDIVTASSRGHR